MTTKGKLIVAGCLFGVLCILGPFTDSKIVEPESTETYTVLSPELEVTPLIPLEPSVATEEPELVLWDKCRVTAYCPCEKCCGKWAKNRPIDPDTGEQIVTGASGARLRSKETCASSLPFGTEIYIPELDLFLTVEDRAAKWIDEKYNSKYVDIYIDDHSECFKYLSGCNEWMEVYLVNAVSK